ncbi:Ig-like domain (group 4) [Promicromonospora umidemergens]|uniref:Bacterial Ig-like domain-containing protein n=1 Tax=Promicromonospora umidemergens TaxID=629679 RepID=A0ABP8XZQ2_9MICO|nr:Ig-like domain-containing protein [Promicromonospora umidemergens]MCP2284202.1 Ig-like domain (group 4) [Promicromonospora umidemergens]
MTTPRTAVARRATSVLGALVLALTGLSSAVAVPSAAPTTAAGATAAEPANVALLATPSASYTASWNRVAAVNDGAGVSTGGSHEDTWATWGEDPRPARQWLEHTWEVPVRVDRSAVRFWSDGTEPNGDNVRVPTSWTIQYWDQDAEAFADLPAPSGFPTDRLGLNETSFEPVTTTRLRATFQALAGGPEETYSAIAVSEWEVWGTGGVVEPDPEDPFGPIDHTPVHVPTQVGVLPELPARIDAVYEDGRVVRVAVTWADVTADDVTEAGSFPVSGTSPDLVEPVEGTVYVRDGDPGPVAAVDNVAVVTLAGTAPLLPPTATAQYEDDSRDSRIPVTWDDVDAAGYAAAGGMFFVAGDVEGTDVPAEAVVFVLEPDTAGDTTPPSVTLTAEPVAAPSGWYVRPVTVTVRVSDNRDPEPRVEVAVDGGEPVPYTGPFALDGDGTHTVRVLATDAAGNVGEAQRDLRVDTTAPVTTASVENLGSSVEITLEATDGDGSGVDRIQWEGPGTFWGTYTGPFTRTLTDTEQVIEFAATDAAGNPEERRSLTLPAAGAELPVTAEASARCVAGTVHVAVRAVNASDVPVDVVLTTEHGSREVTGVEPGDSAYQSFATRAAAVPEATASVTATGTVDGSAVTVRHDLALAALSCV